MNAGSFETRNYPNFLSEIGITDEQADTLVNQAFQTIFFDPEENFCHHTDPDAWCMVDTGNNDARTEGMSYGMMMCVQMDRKDIFDKLWMFSDRYMRMKEGPNAGYFAWSVLPDGTSFTMRSTSTKLSAAVNRCGNRRTVISGLYRI